MSASDNGADLTGRLLAGRYRVTGSLGRGGMGVVCRAYDEVLGREVAVKVLRAYTDASGSELADLRTRMQREARAAARVRHPGVITVHDVTEDAGLPVIVMELVDGPSLDGVLEERRTVEPLRAAAIGAKVAGALDAGHQAGVLHRDVKPGNVLLDRSGRVVLTDFGIATLEAPGDGADTRLTRSGELVGSLDYLAPERAQGHQPGPPSDVWSLGMTLYAAVEGSSPFRRTSVWSTLTAIVTEPLPEPQRAGPLTPVLRALMTKEPARRPTAAQAREMLDAVAAGRDPFTAGGFPAENEPWAAAGPTPGFGPPDHGTDDAATGHRVAEGAPQDAGVTRRMAPVPEDGATRRMAPRERRGRGRGLVAAGVAVAVLAAGGLTYALTRGHGDGSAGDRAGASTTPHPTGALGAGHGRAPSGTPGHGSGSATASDTPTGRPSTGTAPTPSASGSSSTSPPSVCPPAGGGKYHCEVWRKATSYTRDGKAVGVLDPGQNYFYCQADLGRRETYGSWTNVWWARTDDDSGNTGVFVSVVYLKGGDNDQPLPGLPTC